MRAKKNNASLKKNGKNKSTKTALRMKRFVIWMMFDVEGSVTVIPTKKRQLTAPLKKKVYKKTGGRGI